MAGIVQGLFIYNGQPMNGATAKLWPLTSFAAYADSLDEVENTPLAATDIELDVNVGTRFAVGDVIKIESELLKIWAISTNKLYVIRGWRATTPAEHAQNTQIDDETVTEPVQDDDEPASGQVGSTLTTGVAYGGDGCYRWDGVAEGEYFASVEYDSHRSWSHHLVEIDDPTPTQLLRARGDVLIRGVDGVKRLAKGTSGRVLQMGANEPAWSGTGVAATLEFFVPVTSTTGGTMTAKGDFPACSLDNGHKAHIAFKVPHDFSSITSAEIIVIPGSTKADANWDIYSDYGAVGQVYTTHSETRDDATYNITANQIIAIDIEPILQSLAADDYVGINLTVSEVAATAYVLGIRFKYA